MRARRMRTRTDAQREDGMQIRFSSSYNQQLRHSYGECAPTVNLAVASLIAKVASLDRRYAVPGTRDRGGLLDSTTLMLTRHKRSKHKG